MTEHTKIVLAWLLLGIVGWLLEVMAMVTGRHENQDGASMMTKYPLRVGLVSLVLSALCGPCMLVILAWSAITHRMGYQRALAERYVADVVKRAHDAGECPICHRPMKHDEEPSP